MAQNRKISKNNTVIITDNDFTTVILHQTKVVQFNDTHIILDNGGFVSNTTQRRMTQVSNEFNLGFSVSRKNGTMYVTYKGETVPFIGNIVKFAR